MGTFKREIAATASGNVIGTILAFGTAIVLARVLGPADRGLLALAVLIPDIAGKICSSGYEIVNLTFAGLYKDKRSSLFQQTLIVMLSGTTVSILAICMFYFWLPVNRGQFDQLSPEIVLLACLTIPTAMLARLLIALTRGVGKISAAAFIYIVQAGVLFMGVFIGLVLFKGQIRSAVVIMVLAPLVPIAISVWMLRSYVSLRPRGFSIDLFKKGIVFAGQISLSTIARLLNLRLDQAILAFMLPAQQVGLYVVAVGFAERLRLLPSSISAAFLPKLANELSERQLQVPRVYRYTVIISAISMLAAAVLGAPAILLFFGKDFAGAIVSFLCLLPGITVLGGSAILANDMAAREKPKYGLVTGYTTLGVNIILNLVLIPHLGIIGAAVASSISYSLAGVFWLVFFKKESKLSLSELIPTCQDVTYLFQQFKQVANLKIISDAQK
jgi:O-antigen/teichoic acid export membrane protein